MEFVRSRPYEDPVQFRIVTNPVRLFLHYCEVVRKYIYVENLKHKCEHCNAVKVHDRYKLGVLDRADNKFRIFLAGKSVLNQIKDGSRLMSLMKFADILDRDVQVSCEFDRHIRIPSFKVTFLKEFPLGPFERNEVNRNLESFHNWNPAGHEAMQINKIP